MEVKRGMDLFEEDMYPTDKIKKKTVIKHSKLPTKPLLNANFQVKDE